MCLLFLLVLWGCFQEATLQKSDLTREAALDVVDFPLPLSAAHIFYYSKVGGLQYLQRYVWFELSNTEIDSAVEAIIAYNNAQFKRTLAYARQDLPAGEYNPDIVKEAGLDWWNPNNITQGYYRGELDAYAVQIWVDEAHSLIYVYQHD